VFLLFFAGFFGVVWVWFVFFSCVWWGFCFVGWVFFFFSFGVCCGFWFGFFFGANAGPRRRTFPLSALFRSEWSLAYLLIIRGRVATTSSSDLLDVGYGCWLLFSDAFSLPVFASLVWCLGMHQSDVMDQFLSLHTS